MKKNNIPTSFMHVKGCTRNPMGRGVHRRGGTSTGVGGKDCEVIIFTERLDREIMHPTTLASYRSLHAQSNQNKQINHHRKYCQLT